mmetsp:Transcript_26543/g.63445  ORF Transcript_26543/g.63445 Transcript_26543/m.63445 type:complete len:230 (+) Transcript_26543:38-727(+)
MACPGMPPGSSRPWQNHAEARRWARATLSMRRTGSAAPQSSWSPTVKTVRNSGPRFILRIRPTGTRREPLTAAGERPLIVSSLLFGTTRTHSLCEAMACSTSARGTSCVSFTVIAWEWQRMEAIRTHCPSTGIAFVDPKILFVSKKPLSSSLVWPSSTALSIHGISDPASGTPKFAVGNSGERIIPETAASRWRMLARSSMSAGSTSPMAFICETSSRMFFAPAPDAAW